VKHYPVKKLLGAVLLCEVAGGIGSALTRNGLRDWYPNLEKPSFTLRVGYSGLYGRCSTQ